MNQDSLPKHIIPYFDNVQTIPTQIFDVNIKGHKLQIQDIQGSETPGWVARDLNEDPYGIEGLEDLKAKGGVATIVDLGANTGIFSIYASILYPEAQIYAYEPFETNYQNLIKNIGLNGRKNIHPVKMAVTGNGRPISLACPANNSGSASTFHGINIVEKDTPSIVLDQLVNYYGTIDFLKIDIEGLEYEVLWMFEKWSKIHHLSVELHGLFPYPKLLWIEAIKKFANELRPKAFTGNLWLNDLEKL